jgi:hypothetical protein
LEAKVQSARKMMIAGLKSSMKVLGLQFKVANIDSGNRLAREAGKG